MSKNKRNLFGQGLLIASCIGLGLAIADEPVPQPPASRTGPRAADERFLLLSDGRLIRGVIHQDEAGYTVSQKIGVIRYPGRQVERAFDTVEDAYRYRLERVPEEDPAERLQLARWCLSLHLEKEARTLLEQVVEISPSHGPAQAMLTKMNQSDATRIARDEIKVDEEVQRTSGEGVAEDRAGALDSAVLRGAGTKMGITGLPVIFDLPPAMAVRRAEQFKQYVHPVLQAYCAKCHNADHDGPFQLVPVKTSKQRTPDALRANLDATLRQIDRENPAKSDLLSSTLRPHGIGAKARPIFSGSNDRAYQILAAWVTSLRPSAGSDPSTPAAARATPNLEEAFAVDRNRSGGEVLEEVTRGAVGERRTLSPSRQPAAMGDAGSSYRYVQGRGMVPEDASEADPREFPMPYMLGGPRPIPTAGAAATGNGRSPSSTTRPTPEPRSSASTRPGRATRPVTSDAVDPTFAESPPAVTAPNSGAAATLKKPVKINPKILEKLLQSNANRADGQ